MWLWISPQNKLSASVLKWDNFVFAGWKMGYPPPTITSETSVQRGFRKKCLQNLELKELRGQNLDNKELGSGQLGFTQALLPRP